MSVFSIIDRALKKPPRIVLRRAWREARAEAEAWLGPVRARRLRGPGFLREIGAQSIDEAWEHLLAMPYPKAVSVEATNCNDSCSGGVARIIEGAQRALRHEVTLLGSSATSLGEPIDWQRDYKSGHRWEPKFYRRIDYHDFDRSSDVKFPWELSRFQWLLPAGQAYTLTGDEDYAMGARRVIEDWIDQNPCGMGVNWACPMDIALRLVAWTWLFHALGRSRSWTDSEFRLRFLRSLFLGALFVERNLEESDLNSNHYLADAVGLVFAGLFFDRGRHAQRWSEVGWSILCREGPRQILPDGVDYEGSVAYHRLVMECLYFPARYRQIRGLEIPDEYSDRLKRMASFVASYSRPDGTSPLVGDADDGRVLPLGGQALTDHRYLVGLVCATWHDQALLEVFDGPTDEVYWTLGARAAAELAAGPRHATQSAAFMDAGFFVMRTGRSHVFVDCGPVGLAGRGGHGHNDCLSFEAMLDGVSLVRDSGTFVYTASYADRNRFRSTSAHNTPVVDHREINRFRGPRMLWALANDAKPTLHRWTTNGRDVFRGSHAGYERLRHRVTVTRTMVLDHRSHILAIEDELAGEGEHSIQVPMHLDAGVGVISKAEGRVDLRAASREFRLVWSGTCPWRLDIQSARLSPSYGVTIPTTRLCWVISVELPARIRMCLGPATAVGEEGNGWEQWLEDVRHG